MRDALEWSVAQRGRLAQMANPVVRVHGTAGLAAVVCAEDRIQGSGLYREAIAGLHNLPPGAFGEKGTTVLPAASFTGLWKYVVPAALKCDPDLADAAVNQRSRERMAAERYGANATLNRAWDLIDPSQALDKDDNSDRAAQVANAALDAGDPNNFDIDLLRRFLLQLNEKAPDLADDLFLRALEFVRSAEVPDPDGLQQLAKFLFTSASGSSDSFQVEGATVEILTRTRTEANPDNIEALIDATLRLLAVPAAVNRNPVAAYSLVWQLLPRARDLVPERVDALENAGADLEASYPGLTAQIRSQLGSPASPDPESNDAARDFWLAGQVRSALAGRQVEAARDLLPRVSDLAVRGQLSALIAFGDAVRAIEARSEQAMVLANLLRGGIKRSLLYAGIAATTSQLDLALQVMPLATRDIAPLPAEQRIRLLAALAAALVRSDTQSAMTMLDLLVRAYNDAYVNPRRGKFDPRASRALNDSPLILAGPRGLYEAVQTRGGRRNFPLKAPGVTAFTIGGFLAAVSAVDPARLEAAILGLRDENTRAGALVRLAETRIRGARGR